MNTQDQLKASGALRVVLTGPDGVVKEEHEFKNLVVTVGKNFVASRMVGVASNVMSHMAIGSDSTTPAAANTTLGTELGRVALASSVATNNVVTYTATFPAGTGTGGVRCWWAYRRPKNPASAWNRPGIRAIGCACARQSACRRRPR